VVAPAPRYAQATGEVGALQRNAAGEIMVGSPDSLMGFEVAGSLFGGQLRGGGPGQPKRANCTHQIAGRVTPEITRNGAS